jgi:hypothetical protein
MLTLGVALDSLTGAGDTLLIMGGTWYENNGNFDGNPVTLIFSTSGAAGNPIVIKNYPDSARPIIQGQFVNDGSGHRAAYISTCNYVNIENLVFTRSYHHGLRLENVNYVNVRGCTAYLCGDRANDNSSGIGLYSATTPHSSYVTVKACSTYSVYADVHDSTAGADENCSGILAYTTDHSDFDSNFVDRISVGTGGVGIRMKEFDENCSIAYNVITGCGVGIQLSTAGVSLTAHHNILYNIRWDGILIRCSTGFGDSTYLSSVYNNTLYNINNGGLKLFNEAPMPRSRLWNNIVVNAHLTGSNYNFTTEANNHPYLYSDYNSYYNSATNNIAYWNGSSTYTLAQLIAGASIDSHSVGSGPVFLSTTPGDADFLYLDTTATNDSILTGGRGGSYDTYMGAYGPDVAPPADETPPTISGVTVAQGIDTCSVHWHTDEAANGTVDYNTDNGASWSSTGNAGSYITSHYFQLTSLSADQLYYYRIRSCDEAANCDTSNVGTFTTLSNEPPAETHGKKLMFIKRNNLPQ